MTGDASRRVRLFMLDRPGAGVVFEREDNGRYTPVHIVRSLDRARAWTEGHYQEVEWESATRAMASTGGLRQSQRALPRAADTRSWEGRPVTYASPELRTRLPELLEGAKGPVILQQCDEYVPESDRWEPVVTILWESTW